MIILCVGASLTAGYSSHGYFPYASYLSQYIEEYFAAKQLHVATIGGGDGGEMHMISSKENKIKARGMRVDHIGMSGYTTLELALSMDDEENKDW